MKRLLLLYKIIRDAAISRKNDKARNPSKESAQAACLDNGYRDRLCLRENAKCCFWLHPCDPEFEIQMKLAEEGMEQYCNTAPCTRKMKEQVIRQVIRIDLAEVD